MRCRACGLEIDLGLTKEEEESILIQMDEFGVVLICVECSNIYSKGEVDDYSEKAQG